MKMARLTPQPARAARARLSCSGACVGPGLERRGVVCTSALALEPPPGDVGHAQPRDESARVAPARPSALAPARPLHCAASERAARAPDGEKALGVRGGEEPNDLAPHAVHRHNPRLGPCGVAH